jgi:TRAP-type mannitol/chloroaromatic compound transport system permease large subunit
VVLQTSFLTPPFGYALFYLRSIAPKEVKTTQIIRGVLPFIGLIVLMCILVALVPSLVTWLPDVLYTK